jgi:RNA polymerase sigma-70 factor (ECF subfamily)
MWPDTNETQELLRQAGEGQVEAVENLLNRHRDSLWRMIRVRLDKGVAQRVDASDIVQEVLLEASQRLDDYVRDPRLPFHLWLRCMAKDHLLDAHRRHRGAQRRSVDREQPLVSPGGGEHSEVDLAGQIADHELTPAAEMLRKEMAQRFLQALEQLGEDDREILLMRHYEQLSNSEVATALGLSQPAAGMRYLRALRRLRTVIGDPSFLGEVEAG